MSNLLIAVSVALSVAGLILWYSRKRRLLALAQMRGAWGAILPVVPLDDETVTDAWLELRHPRGDLFGLDERTWSDLDLDDVLAAIDHTHTSLGRQVLYWRMRCGVPWTAEPALEELAIHFRDDRAVRERVALRLRSAGRVLGRGIWIIMGDDKVTTRWWYWSFPLLALLMLASIVAIPFEPRALVLAVALAVVNMGVRMATLWRLPGVLIPIRQAGPLIRTAHDLASIPAAAAIADGSITDDLARLHRLKRIAWWVAIDPLVGGDVAASIWEYLNLLFLLDANAMVFGASELRNNGQTLTRVATWVGSVDAAYSVASLRADSRPWAIPVRGGDRAAGRGVWHPLLEHPIANDVDVVPARGVIVTGANMAGKSTYLRSAGVAVVLANAIGTCPAESWRGPAWRPRSLIGRGDDIRTGKSYYQAEADRVAELLRDAADAQPTLFILDELLRGTNTIERLAAGEAVLRVLLAADAGGRHAVLVATHDGELVAMLRDLFDPVHFRETIGPGGIVFDFRKREGGASTRTAIALLEATGVDASVIAAARARAEQLDTIVPPTWASRDANE